MIDVVVGAGTGAGASTGASTGTGAGTGASTGGVIGAGEGVYPKVGTEYTGARKGENTEGDGELYTGTRAGMDVGAGTNAALIGDTEGANVVGKTGAYGLEGVKDDANGTFETTVPPFLFLTVHTVVPLIIEDMSLLPIKARLQSISFMSVFIIGFKSKGVYGSFCSWMLVVGGFTPLLVFMNFITL